jgi:hypothetical protein
MNFSEELTVEEDKQPAAIRNIDKIIKMDKKFISFDLLKISCIIITNQCPIDILQMCDIHPYHLFRHSRGYYCLFAQAQEISNVPIITRKIIFEP